MDPKIQAIGASKGFPHHHTIMYSTPASTESGSTAILTMLRNYFSSFNPTLPTSW